MIVPTLRRIAIPLLVFTILNLAIKLCQPGLTKQLPSVIISLTFHREGVYDGIAILVLLSFLAVHTPKRPVTGFVVLRIREISAENQRG